MGKRTDKWYSDKLIKYFYEHYGEYDKKAEWFVNLAAHRWVCHIPCLDVTIRFTCDDEGNVSEEKVYKTETRELFA